MTTPMENQLLELALQIALDAHKNQLDKAGMPYILHPLRVMMRQTSMKHMIIAALHDVVEDSNYTIEDLRTKGFPEDVLSAVEALTRPDNMSYEAYIAVVRQNPMALKVKLADLEDNINPLRLKNLNALNLERLQKYHRAYMYLIGERESPV